jgi:hypothetical protein
MNLIASAPIKFLFYVNVAMSLVRNILGRIFHPQAFHCKKEKTNSRPPMFFISSAESFGAFSISRHR